MEEEEALRSYCTTMISRVRNKRQHLQSSGDEEGRRHEHKGGRGRERTEPGRVAVSGDELRDYRARNLRERPQPSLSFMSQGPEVQPVPLQFISVLRLKTFKEEMRRAAEAELHDPAVCSVCEQKQAFLALKSFIWRKKTQLQFQTLKGRLNTLNHRNKLGEFIQNLPKSCNAPRWIWEELLGEDMRVTATWGCLSNH